MSNELLNISNDAIQEESDFNQEAILDIQNITGVNVINVIYRRESVISKIAGILNGFQINPDSITDELTLGREHYQIKINKSNEESLDVL